MKAQAPRPPRYSSIRDVMKGITPPRTRLALLRCTAARLRAHQALSDPYTLPTYRHPQARRRAREARRAS